MNCRRQFIEEKGYSYLNNNLLNEYVLWLEQKLTETNQHIDKDTKQTLNQSQYNNSV